jgi:hypothetical protein
MRPDFQRGLRVVVLLAFAFSGFVARASEAPSLAFVRGEVLLREADGVKLKFAKKDMAIPEGMVLVTGENGQAEVRLAGGLWRLGRRAVFAPDPAGGGRLLAGTALAVVPPEQTWRVESSRGLVALGAGTWILQAVDNEGLKLICLNGPAEAVALGEMKTPAAEPLRKVKLRPGELVFLLPKGKAFGPVVTIFLQELLATSRLVGAFPDALPDAVRIRNLAQAQSGQLKGVTNAVVGGAKDEKGFQLIVPKAAPAKEKPAP